MVMGGGEWAQQDARRANAPCEGPRILATTRNPPERWKLIIALGEYVSI